MRLLLMCVAMLIGCRGRFDAAAVDAGPDSPPDLPLPDLACARSVLKIPAVSEGAELAISSRSTGYAVAWADVVSGTVMGASVDLNRRLVGAPQLLVERGATGLPGIKAVATRVWMVVSEGALQNLYAMAPDLSGATLRLAEPSISGDAPIGVATDTTLSPVWIRASATEKVLKAAYLPATGGIGTDVTEVTGALVTDVSVADYQNHVHLAWRDASGSCFGSDVKFDSQPQLPAPVTLSTDCKSLRITSGPDSYDPLVSTWINSAGVVQAKYVGGALPPGGSYFMSDIARGRAPKIAFDGTRYWIAWADSTGVRFTTVEKDGLVGAAVAVPGVTPTSDGAFELVRRGSAVDLVTLERSSISFLTLCTF